MSKSSIILDGPSFYTKLGRFYSKWAASQAPSDQPASVDATSSTFEVFVFICLDTLISLVRLLLLDVQGTGRLTLDGILGEAGGAWVGDKVVR